MQVEIFDNAKKCVIECGAQENYKTITQQDSCSNKQNEKRLHIASIYKFMMSIILKISHVISTLSSK